MAGIKRTFQMAMGCRKRNFQTKLPPLQILLFEFTFSSYMQLNEENISTNYSQLS